MKFDTQSTITAIATGSEGALRGALRVSGPLALEVVGRAFPETASAFSSCLSARSFDQVLMSKSLGTIATRCYVWPSQRSYTGQPSVEIHSLGAPVILTSLQNQILEHGAVLAQPGEFTLRAFLAGRLDLTQCEAVLGVIHATSDRSLKVALQQLAGGLAAPLSSLRTDLINLLADIEAGLDFVDEDISFISDTQIADRLQHAIACIGRLVEQMDSRSAQSVQLQIAIIGPPNAGKSSLLNALGGKSVSIVSDTPGTTRDYVRLRMEFDGIEIDLLDTAGIEEIGGNSPRAIAQQFTREQIENADLLIECKSLLAEDRTFQDANALQESESAYQLIGPSPRWLVETKLDLVTRAAAFPESNPNLNDNLFDKRFQVSSTVGTHIHDLKKAIDEWAHGEAVLQSQVVPATAKRCYRSLIAAHDALTQAADANSAHAGHEIVAGEMRLALEEIGMVVGEIYTEDILDALFSRFCIGK